MNRRSILKAAVGACTALLFSWRKAKAGPSWARIVDFVPSKHKYPCPDGTFDQTLRIERLLERWPENKPTGKLADLETTTYKMDVSRVPWMHESATEIFLVNRCIPSDLSGVVQISDSVAASMSDSELSDTLTQAFLRSLHKREEVCIKGKVRYTKKTICLLETDKLGGLSKT